MRKTRRSYLLDSLSLDKVSVINWRQKIVYHQRLKICPYVATIKDKDMKMKMRNKGKSCHASPRDKLTCPDLLANIDFCAPVCKVVIARIFSMRMSQDYKVAIKPVFHCRTACL